MNAHETLRQTQRRHRPRNQAQDHRRRIIRVLKRSEKIGHVDFLVQGTIYPDVIESGLGKLPSSNPTTTSAVCRIMWTSETSNPCASLFKDEVREVGRQLAHSRTPRPPSALPRPWPRHSDHRIVTAESQNRTGRRRHLPRVEIDCKAGIAGDFGQYFAALTNLRSVGVMGDGRTYDYAIALRAVLTTDFMTAESAPSLGPSFNRRQPHRQRQRRKPRPLRLHHQTPSDD